MTSLRGAALGPDAALAWAILNTLGYSDLITVIDGGLIPEIARRTFCFMRPPPAVQTRFTDST